MRRLDTEGLVLDAAGARAVSDERIVSFFSLFDGLFGNIETHSCPFRTVLKAVPSFKVPRRVPWLSGTI